MTNKHITIEYDLADIVGFASRSLEDLRARGLRFLRYGSEFVGSRSFLSPEKALTLAETQTAIQATRRRPQHAIRVYVACKHLAGEGGGLGPHVRVFSSSEAMNHYLDDHHDDDPSPHEDDILISMTTCIVDAVSDHKPCHCTEQLAQEDALEALKPALPCPEGSKGVNGRGTAVQPRATSLGLELEDGRRLEVPRSWFAFLDAEDAAQWQGACLDGTRRFVKWPGTRKRVSIAGLLAVA